MTSDSPAQDFLQQFTHFRCSDCGSEVGFRSRRRTFSERYLLPIFLLMPVRCSECFRREYRTIFARVLDRQEDAVRPVPSTKLPGSTRNVA